MTGRKPYVRPLDLRGGRIDMTHGGGGRASAQLIDELFLRAFDTPHEHRGDDGAVMDVPAGCRLVTATDAHVVSPLFFPGGDIGCLAVHGTINDVAMMGAMPRWLTAAFILEEGYPLADLKRIADSMAAAARNAGVTIVAGDTKVVERGKADGVFISTTGVGVLPVARRIGGRFARAGDAILLSGSIGDHGLAVLSQRESLGFDTVIESDTAALHTLVAAVLAAVPEGAVHAMRDPTRGGLATVLNEIAQQSALGMLIEEAAVPVNPQVAAACELLGLDPFYIASEGRCVVICDPAHADRILATLRAHPLGRAAARIGAVTTDSGGFVQMTTALGGRRMLDWLAGEPLPRIC